MRISTFSFNSYILEAGEALYAAAVAQGREGIVAKKRDSRVPSRQAQQAVAQDRPRKPSAR